ncbi:flagellar biosynthetic protein FliO [Salinisphaera sp. LB1]|uniref:flagellar biosynthetic protein FliO n=1 Tax=Salinisphaera sp. LB1 TaxID=2183911 RepID=UPI000D707A0A|nr:flagellar biosynthetic protein FliO [Salinisphaera sp. LB1]AWN16033.1 Flagellar biosynthesis protein FliQ [Salinisphaera sp. LB1]
MSDTGRHTQPGAHPAGGITPSWFDQPGAAGKASGPATTHTTTDASAAPAGSGNLPANLIGRTSIALIGVIAVILVCAWVLKRLGFQRDRASQSLPIVASRSLGQRERVVVVEVEGEWLVLGVTPHHITALHRRPAPAEPATAATADEPGSRARPTFGQALAENLARVTGRSRR